MLRDVDPHEDLQVVQRGILNVSRIVAVGWLAILQRLARYSSEAGSLFFRCCLPLGHAERLDYRRDHIFHTFTLCGFIEIAWATILLTLPCSSLPPRHSLGPAR